MAQTMHYINRFKFTQWEEEKMIRIIVDQSSRNAEEFSTWLNTQDGIEAWVEPQGRHTAGKHVVENYDDDRDELLAALWGRFCNS
jgi:hypothetical protein